MGQIIFEEFRYPKTSFKLIYGKKSLVKFDTLWI